MKSVLIISYYWPPSGGAGVQRWLKLSKYLAQLDTKVFVLSVDEQFASYPKLDHSHQKDIHPNIKVYKTKAFNPIEWYGKIAGKKNIPTGGFSNVDNTKWTQKAVNFLRSNLFIPDPRKGWNGYAIRQAKQLIKTHNIQNVITTSPPHSTQLIGLKLKRFFKNDIYWIVDFRDPWTDIYYYNLLNHSFLSKKLDQKYEKQVIEESDHIVTVSSGFKRLFLEKSEHIKDNKIDIIPNGFDEDDFKILESNPYKNNLFTIRYTGTMADSYEPSIFLKALKQVHDLGIEFCFETIGVLSPSIKTQIKTLGFPHKHIDYVDHTEIVKYQQSADILLLVIPKIKNGEGIVPGKVFEYIAAQQAIICISETACDVNAIIENLGVGKAFNRDNAEHIAEFIQHIQTKKFVINKADINIYSRKEQAKVYFNTLKS